MEEERGKTKEMDCHRTVTWAQSFMLSIFKGTDQREKRWVDSGIIR